MHTFPWWLAWLPASIRTHVGRQGQLLQVIGNSGWLLADRLARTVLGLLVGAWVARYLGPTEFGLLAYVVANVAIFQAFANIGADAIVVRDIAQQPSETSQILGSVLMLRLCFGSICWLGAVGSAWALSEPGSSTVAMTAVVAGTLIFQAADVVDLWFQSQSQSKRTVVSKLAAYVVANGGKVVLILIKAPLLAFAAVTAAEAGLAAVALWAAYRRFPAGAAWSATASMMRRLLREAWPFMLSGLSIMVYMRVDQLLVKEYLGPRELGIFAAVLPVSQLWQAIPLAVAVSIAPMVAQAKVRDLIEYRQVVLLIFRAFFVAGVVSAFVTWAVSGILVPLLFGQAFVAAVPILNVHAISNIFCFLGIAHGLWLTSERRFGVRLCGTMLAGLVTVALNVYLLPRIGLMGASYAAIASQCVAALLINAVLDPQGFRLQVQAITFRKA